MPSVCPAPRGGETRSGDDDGGRGRLLAVASPEQAPDRRDVRPPAEPGGMDRRRRLELAIPFWTYLVLIAVGVTLGIVVGLTHH